MTSLKIKHFDDIDTFNLSVANLLVEHMTRIHRQPHAILLSGGSTPVPIYHRLAGQPHVVSRQLWVLYSDERMTSATSPDSNYGSTRPFLATHDIADARVLRVDTSQQLDMAARKYNDDIAGYLAGGGVVTLGLLGIGTDGHTASLFSIDDAGTDSDYVLAVRNQRGFDRISVTRKVLLKVEELVFLATGALKKKILRRFIRRPESIPAGVAVAGHNNVEIWTNVNTDYKQ